jgi:hypothetical protein
MKRFVIERDFEYKGFRCVVIFTKGGFRNGYVGYSEPHDLTDEEKEKIETEFCCHGGVTYIGGGKGSHHPVDSNSYWLGFDCGHYGDEIDVDQAVEYKLISPEVEPIMRMQEGLFGGHAMTEEEVAQECKKLVDQMEEVGYHG